MKISAPFFTKESDNDTLTITPNFTTEVSHMRKYETIERVKNTHCVKLPRRDSDMRCREWSDAEKLLVIKAYVSGKSIRHCRQLVGVSWTATKNLLSAEGVLKQQHKKKI